MLITKHQVTITNQSPKTNHQKPKLVIGVWLLVIPWLLFLGYWNFASGGIEDVTFKRGIGVRAQGMGGAYTAIADDGSATLNNPAGLAENGLALTFGNLDTEQKEYRREFELLKLGYFGYAKWNTGAVNGDQINAQALGLGLRSGWLNYGLNYKWYDWSLAGVSNNGWSSDFGFIARITPQFRVGLLAQDVLTSKGVPVGSSGRIGIGYVPFDGSLTIAGDVEYLNQAQTYGHLGLEARVGKGVTIRGGVDRGEATAGLSLDFSAFSFDYGALFERNGQTIHRFEAGLKFLPKRERPFSIIKPKEFALIDVSGAIRGGRSEYSFLGGYQLGLDSLLQQIRRATKDNSIDGIMLKLGGFDGGLGGLAVVQELRGELAKARAAGKKIVAYAEGGASGDEYYLAAFADKIIAPPGSAIGGFGKSIEILRIRGAYKKIGIEWQTYYKGKYKMAFDPFSAKMSADQEEMLKGIVADLYRQLLTDVAADRQINLERLKEIGDGTLFTAKQARDLKLIDDIGYFKDARKLAAELAGDDQEEARIVETDLLEPQEESLLGQVFGVAVIEIDGELVTGAGGENLLFGGRFVGSDTISDYIKQASDDVFVKAIILRINSPGGTSISAGEIYRAVQYARDKGKKVIASIGNIGASGGYYIAAAADKIVADRGSLVGSIGIYQQLPIFAELLKKLDATAEVIKEGEHADMYSGLRKPSPKEVESIEKMLNEGYHDFVQAVVAGRQLPTAEIEAAAQGRLYTGSQALEVKLVDQLGGFSDAVSLAKAEAKLIGEPRLIFYHQPSLFFSFGYNLSESLGLKELGLGALLPWKPPDN